MDGVDVGAEVRVGMMVGTDVRVGIMVGILVWAEVVLGVGEANRFGEALQPVVNKKIREIHEVKIL